MMRKILFFCCLLQPPKVFAVQKWPLKLHSNSSVSLESGENNILFDSDVTTIYNKLTLYADVDFDFSTEFELAAKSLEELEVDVFDAETSQPSPPPPPNPPQLQWHLAESSSDDCDVVCAAHGKVCDVDALQFDYVALSGNYVDLFAAASSAGISCNNGGGVGSISAPIYHNGNCYQYNPPSNQVCSGSVGFGLRICPCV
jgi:hypothetical protein